VFFGGEDWVVVFIAHRLERGPVSSRVGVFPEVFSVADSTSNSTERRSKLGLDGDRRLVSLAMTGACLSSKEQTVVLYAIKREPSDLGG